MKNVPFKNLPLQYEICFGQIAEIIEPEKELWSVDDKRIYCMFLSHCKQRFAEKEALIITEAIPGLLELPMLVDKFTASSRERYKRMLLQINYEEYLLFTKNILEKTRMDQAIQVAEIVFKRKLGSDRSREEIARFHSLKNSEKIKLGYRFWKEIRSFCLDVITTPVR